MADCHRMYLILIFLRFFFPPPIHGDGLDTTKKAITHQVSVEPKKANSSTNGDTKALSTADWVSILASVSTAVTALLTYLLLLQTRNTIRQNDKALQRDRDRQEAESIGKVLSNFKDAYSEMMSDKDGIAILAREDNLEKVQVKENFFGSFLINNTFEIYNLQKKGFIKNDYWQFILVDMKDFFNFQFIQRRWASIKILYPTDFQKFIDNEVVGTGFERE
jgi:hypothetical protein